MVLPMHTFVACCIQHVRPCLTRNVNGSVACVCSIIRYFSMLIFIASISYRAFVSDRSGELPVPPEGTEVGSRVSLM